MAQGFLSDRSRRLLRIALRVRSSGTWARLGLAPTPEAVGAAGERGVDIADLRSTPFAPAQAAWADVVVSMTAEQRREVLDQAPDAAPKTFTLKELVTLVSLLPPPRGAPSRSSMIERVAQAHRLRMDGARAVRDEDVADPLGMSPQVYRATAWEIEELVDALILGLAGHRQPVAAGEE
jgi:protein-tyrosine phosphatase